MSFTELIDQYAAGPDLIRQAVSGMTAEQLDARPMAGQWSTREVICHLADFELVYADRLKRVIAEDSPTLFGGDPDLFAAGLAYAERDVENELALIATTRWQVSTILRALPESALARVGVHSEAGPLTLETFLRNVTGHIPHHIAFIQEKRQRM